MLLEIIKFLGQEDIPWDEILSFFHLLDSVPIKFSEHKKVEICCILDYYCRQQLRPNW